MVSFYVCDPMTADVLGKEQVCLFAATHTDRQYICNYICYKSTSLDCT